MLTVETLTIAFLLVSGLLVVTVMFIVFIVLATFTALDLSEEISRRLGWRHL